MVHLLPPEIIGVGVISKVLLNLEPRHNLNLEVMEGHFEHRNVHSGALPVKPPTTACCNVFVADLTSMNVCTTGHQCKYYKWYEYH